MAGVVVRKVDAPLCGVPTARRGAAAFWVATCPFELDVRAAECAVAGSKEMVSRAGAAASEWLWPEKGGNQALTVRVNCAAEAQRVEEGESRGTCQELHEKCGAAEL